MARSKKATEQETKRNSPYERHVRKSNTALCGNQGSPQPGAPRSHRAGHTGINSHRSGAILRPAMTQSRSRRKGETDTISGQVAFLWCIVCVRQVSRDFPVGFYSPDTKEGDSRQWRDFLLGSNPFHNSAAFSMQKTRGKTNIGRTRSAVRCIANKMISSKGTSCRGTQVF